MEDTTRRTLAQCARWLGEYLDGKLELETLVGSLEQALNSIEEKLPSSFYIDWYEHWGGLEIEYAVSEVNMAELKPSNGLAAESARALLQVLETALAPPTD